MANLFDGYIESVGKRPKYSVLTDKDKITKEPPQTGDYTGVLKDGIIQVDFDNSEQAELALKIVQDLRLRCDILKTSRGYHLYFLNDDFITSQSVGLYNAIGLNSDIGLGSKHRVVPLRITKEVITKKFIDGQESEEVKNVTTNREWVQTYSELDVVPPFFRPISNRDYELGKTQTRNQSLFSYILVLQSKFFTKEEVRQTIKIINKYVLYEPLSDKEIDMITRDSAFSEDMFFGEKGAFLHDRFGNYMLANCDIVLINGQCHIYTDNHLYSNDINEFEKVMISKIPSLKDNQRKEVYKYICLKCKREVEFCSPKYIGLKDSILDIETMEELPYSPSIIINNRIDYRYLPDAYHETMDKTLDKVCRNDKQIRALLEEMIGYTLYRKNSMQVCFILTGEGANGKSTILNCLKRLVGKRNYTALDLAELNETFKPAELYGKLLNVGDDLSSKFLDNSSIFKKVVTGESILVQRKYQNPFELESYATQVFSTNEMPSVKDKTDGFGRRLVMIPFNAKFTKSDPDYNPFIEEVLNSDEAMEYLLKLAIDGLKRVLLNQSFTKSELGENEKEEYIMANNPLLEYFSEGVNLEHEGINDSYMQYCVWCARNGCQHVKKINFSKEVRRLYGLVSKPKNIDGKTIRVYEKEVE